MKKAFYSLLFLAMIAFIGCMGGKEVTVANETKAEVKTETKAAVKEEMGKRDPATIPPGKITWAAANDRYSAQGTFHRWQFTKVNMAKGDIMTLNADLAIDLTSIWEKSPKLTEHLKADDYFGVNEFSTATMNISNVDKKGDGYQADLSLSMRGNTQKMKANFTIINKKPLTVKGTAEVDRGVLDIAVANTKVPNMIVVEFETVIPQ